VKFTPPGGTIGLDVTPDETRNVVSFSVWDTGIGIGHEHMNRLFRPFEQLDGGLNKQYEGMGLGLALVARLAEMHSGSVSVESEVGQGSRFTVLLPWQHTLDTKTANDQEWNAPLNIQRALLIANTSPNEEPVVQHLEALGIEVHIHRGGTNALEQIRVIQPDIILLDPVLPDLSGWQVLMHIKAETAEQDIPVIMLSLLDEHMRALALGAADCLVRPISRQDMQQTLTKVSWYLKHTLDAAAPALPDESSKPPLILLTDDNDATIHLLSEYLISQGYRVDVARNGSEAVQYIREQRPDLVLMDWQMPVMNGLEATHHIRRDASLDDLPIIALTALAMPGDRESCLAAGVNEYLSKPVSLQELMHVIRRYLGQRGQG
jgi:CheY-like chemotaxis protein